jgi:hypothetical protein
MPRTRPSSSLRHSPQPSLTWTSSWHRSPTPRRLPDGNRRSVDHPSPSGGSSDRRYTPGATDGPPPIELWHVRTPGRSRTWTGCLTICPSVDDADASNTTVRHVERPGRGATGPLHASEKSCPAISARVRRSATSVPRRAAPARAQGVRAESARRTRSGAGPWRQARTARPGKRGKRIARGVRLSRRTRITDRHNATPAMIESSSSSS